MQRARRHQRVSAGLAFALLALVAELAGRSLTHRLDFGRHVATPSYSGADYYPFLLAGVKLGVALLFARLAWRFVRAHAAARAGRRVLATVGSRPAPAPRVRLELSPPPLARSLPRHLDLLPRPARRRAGRGRTLAAVLALAAQLGAAGVRRARRARGARVERRRVLAERVRAVRAGHVRPRRADPDCLTAPAQPAHRDRLRASAQALRPRLREPATSRSRLARGHSPAPRAP